MQAPLFRLPKTRPLMLVALGVAFTAGSALGQLTGAPKDGQAVTVTAPTPGKLDDPPVFMTYLLLLVLGAAVIGANLLPSKRGHQD